MDVRCRHCGHVDPGHAETCLMQPPEVQARGLREQIRLRDDAYRRLERAMAILRRDAALWEGKFHQVKRENNALRRRLYQEKRREIAPLDDRVGQYKEVKEEVVVVPSRPYPGGSATPEAAAGAVAPFEVDGWRATRPMEVFDTRRLVPGDLMRARVSFERWVEADGDETPVPRAGV